MRIIGTAMTAAGSTRADEPGSVNGTLDLLMDTMVSSLGPLLSLAQRLPGVHVDSHVTQQLMEASIPHTPMFQ